MSAQSTRGDRRYRCAFCKSVHSFDDLLVVEGHIVKEVNGKGCYQQLLFKCPGKPPKPCGRVLLCDTGTGKIVPMQGAVEIIES